MAKFYVVVVSDRVFYGIEKDVSGLEAIKLLEKSGHEVVGCKYAPNDTTRILDSIIEGVEKGVNAILVVGGTGLGPKDVSVDAIKSLRGVEIPGFGELFRSLTFSREGTKSWLTRAFAMLYKETIIFAVPGRVEAVKLALKEIILPEIEHVVKMVKGHSHWEDEINEC